MTTDAGGRSMVQNYSKPPITEAVLEIRPKVAISEQDLSKIKKRFSTLYPNSIETRDIDFEIDPNQRSASVARERKGFQLQNLDKGEICWIKQGSFSVSQLPPYPGWGVFKERAIRDWEIWKKVVGYRESARLGLRFINRIDVPLKMGELSYIEDYLAAYPHFPDRHTPLLSFAMNSTIPSPDISGAVVINVAQTDPPSVGFASYVLDIDVGIGEHFPAPSKDEEIWEFFNSARQKKNAWFEECVTEKARELFR